MRCGRGADHQSEHQDHADDLRALGDRNAHDRQKRHRNEANGHPARLGELALQRGEDERADDGGERHVQNLDRRTAGRFRGPRTRSEGRWCHMKVFSEQTSAVGPRKGLETALDYLREDDVLVVTKLDRLARSVADLCAIIEKIEQKGASLRILTMNLDTATPTGRLMVNVIGSVAQFEREIMLERQREGVQRAKREGKYKGRAPTARAKASEIVRLANDGMKREEIAKRLGVGVASVYRMLAEQKGAHAKVHAEAVGALGSGCEPSSIKTALSNGKRQ